MCLWFARVVLVLLFVLARENFADAVEGVDFSDGFVWAKAGNAGKAEGEAAVVTIRTLDVVEGDFDNDEWTDGSNVAVIFDGVGEEIFWSARGFRRRLRRSRLCRC